MLILEIMYFNPRSLTGATGGGIVAQLLEQFQSTLPRGSDADEHLLQAVLRISIHAPSRERPGAHPAPCRARHFNPRSLSGATGPSAVACDWSRYFNPRSLAGATIGGTAITPMTAFQSTLPRGSDTSGGGSAGGGAISIHAPSRERLSGANTPIDGQVISIHAPSRERLVVWIHIILISLFQSTLPRGSDGIWSTISRKSTNFNPRSLAGATKINNVNVIVYSISIHAPSRERPLVRVDVASINFYFNPRSLAGATFTACPA